MGEGFLVREICMRGFWGEGKAEDGSGQSNIKGAIIIINFWAEGGKSPL